MTRDYFAIEEDVTIAEAVAALQKRSEEFEMVFYVYVVDRRDHLVGVISLKKLLTTTPSTQLKRVMEPKVISARTDAEQEEVARLIAEYNLLAVPITDEEDRLVGIVTVDDAIDVIQGEVAEDLLALAGTLIPMSLKRLKIDPAVASSVFVTTFTDVCGSLSFLGIATLMMRLLKAG